MRRYGVIQGVQIALGRGIVRPDDEGGDIPFRREDLPEGGFEELREGQWVTYEEAAERSATGLRYAQDIRPA